MTSQIVLLQVLIRAEHLPHVFSSSSSSRRRRRRKTRRPDAFAVLSNVSELGRVLGIQKDEIARTEVIPHCDSPEWARVLLLRHTRGTQHRIAVDIFHQHDDDDNQRNASSSSQNNKILCGLLLDVETILSSRDSMMMESIPGSRQGKLYVTLEESRTTTTIQQPYTHLRLQLRGFRLHNTRKFVLERPDFLYEIRRKQRGHTQDSWGLVFRSAVVQTTLNPLFEKELLDLSMLCNSDLQRELQITLVDHDCHDSNTHRHLLGSTRVTVQTMLEQRSEQGNCDRNKALEIHKGMNDYYNSYRPSSFTNLGKLVVVHAELVGTTNANNGMVATNSTPTTSTSRNGSSAPLMAQAVQVIMPPPMSFDDYFQNYNNARLELCVAIDFSIKQTHNLLVDGRFNDYEWILNEVGQAVSQYNSTQQYPVWGLGAKFAGKVYPIFQVGPSSRATGVSGLLEYYRSVFQTPEFEFGGEAKYDHVIQAAAHFSKQQLDGAQARGGISYTMLLVLTTGSDEQILEAREKLESVQSAPLSVVFVRMGFQTAGGRLDAMRQLSHVRPYCTFLDAKSFGRTNSVAFVEASLGSVKEQLSVYFASREVFPTTTR